MSTVRVAIVAAQEAVGVGGIQDYSRRLLEALSRRRAVRPTLLIRQPDGSWLQTAGPAAPELVTDLPAALRANDVVVLQYNPFMYGRWGFAPWLPLLLARARRSPRPPRIGLMIHETYIPALTFRSGVMSLWQRMQLRALRAGADVVMASIELWANRLRATRPAKDTFHVPVSSNLPDRSVFREEERARAAIGETTIVVATIGSDHPSLLREYVVAALNDLAGRHFDVVFLNLGAGAPAPRGLSERIEVRTPGLVSAEELALMLATADIFLAPFVDGVSTRRTSLMAALQHGLAVVGTEGPLTDGIFRREQIALVLTPVGRVSLFADAVVRLAESEGERRALGMAGRELYEREFDWPVLSSRLIAAMGMECAA
jgi:glycosyltransferase involved in cell wall biosynthesis